MKVHCSTGGCDGITNRLNGKCRDCKATTVVAPAPVLMPVVVHVPSSDGETAGQTRRTDGHLCGACGHAFPILVDDVLCIRCDSFLYPALLYPAAVAS